MKALLTPFVYAMHVYSPVRAVRPRRLSGRYQADVKKQYLLNGAPLLGRGRRRAHLSISRVLTGSFVGVPAWSQCVLRVHVGV